MLPVLIVEDTLENQLAAKQAFRELGVKMVLVGTVAGAMDALGAQTFRAAIFDIQVPMEDGGSSRPYPRELSKLAEEHDVPHLFLSANYDTKPATAYAYPNVWAIARRQGVEVSGKHTPEGWSAAWEKLCELYPEII